MRNILKSWKISIDPRVKLHSSCTKNGLKRFFNNKLEEADARRRDEFQTWAEFENRGFKKPEYMTCWLIEQYGNPKTVLKRDTVNVKYEKFASIDARHTHLRQMVSKPNEVLVKVHASSLNPLDIKMCQGYGQNLINLRRNMIMSSINRYISIGSQTEFPVVLGRDFSGTVIDVGSGVHDILPGDEVYGAQEIHRTGALADYICVNLESLSHKPKTLSHLEAASLPYVALTTLCALQEISGLEKGMRVLLLGGSGGIGTFAIQYLKSKGAHVAVTCNPNAAKLCLSLGADQCFDYTSTNYEQLLIEEPRFDCILDIIGAHSLDWAKHFIKPNGLYSSLVSPILENTDDMGIVMGLSASAGSYLKSCFLNRDVRFAWPLYRSGRLGLLEVAKMVDNGSINPVVQKVFDFADVPAAFELVSTGKCKGKVVINVSGLPEASAKETVEKIIHL